MLIYFILLSIICVAGYYPYRKHNSEQSKLFFLFVSFISMTIILGLRGKTVGEDTAHYLHVFECADKLDWMEIFSNLNMRTPYYTDQWGYTDTIENGILVICKLVHLFTDNGQVFLFIIALVTNCLFAKFIYDNSMDVFYSTYIFLTEGLFMMSFNGIRQLLAGAIAIQSYSLLKKKKIASSVALILLGAFIHNTALICIVMVPVMLVKQQKEKKYFKYALIAAIAGPSIIIALSGVLSFFFPRYTTYFTTNYWENSIGGSFIFIIIEILTILFLYERKKRVQDSFSVSVFTAIYIACTITGLKISVFDRIGTYFRPFLLLLFPMTEQIFPKNRRAIRLGMMALLFLLYLSYARTDARQYSFFWK